MRRKKYVQFSGWAEIGAALSSLIDRWDSRGVSDSLVQKRRKQVGEWAGSFERGLWLEQNEEE